MSRTDVHAPSWVKERDPLWRSHYTECHNHAWRVVGREKIISGDGHPTWKIIWEKVERCDLDDYLAGRGFVRTACQMRVISAGRNVDCGCRMCSGQIWRLLSNRAERHATKNLLRSGRWEEIQTKKKWRY